MPSPSDRASMFLAEGMQEPSLIGLQAGLLALKQQQEQALACLITVLDRMSAAGTASETAKSGTDPQIPTSLSDMSPPSTEARTDPDINFSAAICPDFDGSDIAPQDLDIACEAEVAPGKCGEDVDRLALSSKQGCCHRSLSTHAANIVQDKRFDYVTGMVILVNTVTIGIDTQESIHSNGLPSWVDLTFLCIYTAEITLRLCAFGRQAFNNGWIMFDFTLVCLSWTMDLIVPLVLLAVDDPGDVSLVQKLLLLRTVRLLRLIRSLRTIPMFRTAWRLTHGLLTSGNAILSMLSLLLLFLYMFACAGVELISKDVELSLHPDTAYIVTSYFGSLPRILLTLFSFVCADSVAAIYTPLILARPYLAIYFLGLLLLISVTLMNLVTAVLVEGAMDRASADKELERQEKLDIVKAVRPKLLQVFGDLDSDGNGQLTADEVLQVPMETVPKHLFPENIGSMMDVFELLDVGNDGVLSQEEFVEGLLNLLCSEVPVYALQMLRLLRWNGDKMSHLHAKLDRIQAFEVDIANLDTKLDELLPSNRRSFNSVLSVELSGVV